MHPKFATYLSREKRLEIRGLVQRVAELLGSAEIAIDDRHGPKLYSRFLQGLLATPMAIVDTLSPNGLMNHGHHSNRRVARKHKSGSERSIDVSATSVSPSASHSASKPLLADTLLDAFTSVAGNPSATIQDQYGSPSALLDQTNSAPALDAIDWLPTPLPFDDELLQSMQSVQNSVWGRDLSMPG